MVKNVNPTLLHGPGQVEAALLDAVYSIRARYAGPETGVRQLVNRWREHRGGTADDLDVLAAQDPLEVAKLVNYFDLKKSRRVER